MLVTLKFLVVATASAACTSQPNVSGAELVGDSSVSGRVLNIDREVVEGASVCLVERGRRCTLTDANGNYQLDRLPDVADLLIALDADGFVRGMRMAQTGEASRVELGDTLLPRRDAVTLQRQALEIDEVSDSGMIGFFAIGSDFLVTHVRARISPQDGDGPFYFNEQGEIDPLLTYGTEASGYFYNLPASDAYSVTISQPDREPPTPCEQELPGLGWGVDSYGGHRVPVVADAITFVVPVCARE